MTDTPPIRVFSGTAHTGLARAIVERLGIEAGRVTIRYFSDGEIHVRFDESVRGADVYIIQPTCPPVDDNLVELMICLDALRRASVRRLTAVIPYFGYARQEKKDLPREPITAKLVADLLVEAGANRLMVMDLHSDAIQGFFNIPVDHLTAEHVLARHLATLNVPDVVVVSPDEGRVKKARRVAAFLDAPLAVAYRGDSAADGAQTGDPAPVPAELRLAGDVRGRSPVIIEDMITSGQSVLDACDTLLACGCNAAIRVACTHGVLAGDAMVRLAARPEIVGVVTTDTIPWRQADLCDKVTVLTIADVFSEAIRRANQNLSISSLFR
ncbi:MAG: ribose-phosphate diphosphokinase [Armatimonadetes bacterium]|nr:ribose-phosphate diphosphokinase [Armatimonadota bacterium]